MDNLKRNIVRGVMTESRLMEICLDLDEKTDVEVQWYVLENYDKLLKMIKRRRELVYKMYSDAVRKGKELAKTHVEDFFEEDSEAHW